MGKYNVGELLVTKRHVGIYVEEHNGEIIDEVIDYPKGEVFEILEVIEEDGDVSYRIDFGIDNGQIDYTLLEWQIDGFLEEEADE